MKFTSVGALCAGVLLSCALSTAHAVAINGQGTWESTLQGRDLDGNLATFEAYYDTILDITWLANANYAGVEMDWATANAWAASLNPYSSGITGWRLPTVNSIDGTTANDENIAYDGSEDRGYNISAPGTLYADSSSSEMAHLFYNTLGDKSYYTTSGNSPQAGWGLTNTGPFSNIIFGDYPADAYWSAPEFAPDTSRAWGFRFADGYQSRGYKTNSHYAWAVHSGDVGVSAVPLPSAAWLLGIGFLGLVGVSRKNQS